MNQAPIVAVRGETTREVEPEIAEFSVTVEARDRGRPETLRRLTERVAAVGGLLDGYASIIEKRESAAIRIQPETRRSGERISGYRGTVTTTVTVNDFSLLGELMLRLADQELTTVTGLSWSLRPDSLVFRQARREAVSVAIDRAADYAEALGARLLRLVELSDVGMGARTTPVTFAAGYVGASRSASPVELGLDPQRQSVHTQVEARFLISEPAALTVGS